jgi:hypothetical protein
MITTDWEILALECERRGWDMDKLLELAGVAPYLDNKIVASGKKGQTQKKLTYCGKSREQWVRRSK